jgi:hypothetical protein
MMEMSLEEKIDALHDELSKVSAECDRLREALKPFAALEVPKYAEHNAGFYSLFHADVKRARAALAKEAGQ